MDAVVPEWQGELHESDLPLQVCVQIIAEVIRLSFRYELCLVDAWLYELAPNNVGEAAEDGQIEDELAASNRMDRYIKLTALPGLLSGQCGIGAPNPLTHQEGVYNLFRVMRGWRYPYGVSHHMSTLLQRLAPGQSPSPDDLERAEYQVALHYISSFTDFFKRAPILPRKAIA